MSEIMNNTFRINTFEAMKYSRLSAEQLRELEKEFVDFLVVNGIVAEDWIALKENEPLNADKIIDQFSDVVWEGTLRKLKYLNKIETNVKRDRKVTKELRMAGWSVCQIWECQLRKPKRSLARIQKLLTKIK